MKTAVALILLATVLCSGHAFAADPILGTWKLNVAKSKFISGAELMAATRTYTWEFDLRKDGKVVGHTHRVVSADGKTLIVSETGTMVSGRKGDETLVFEKQ
jgi:hypothetical protein